MFFGYLAWHYFWCLKIEAEYTKLVGAGLLLSSAAALLSLAFGALETPDRHFTAGGVVGGAMASRRLRSTSTGPAPRFCC